MGQHSPAKTFEPEQAGALPLSACQAREVTAPAVQHKPAERLEDWQWQWLDESA